MFFVPFFFLAPGGENMTTTTEVPAKITTPTSGVVNVKALAGFVASFAFIALF